MAQLTKEQFIANLSQVEKTKKLSIHELFTEEFLAEFTPFKSIADIFEKSNWGITTQQEFDKIPIWQKDKFIYENTKFATWQEMVQQAMNLWIDKQLAQYHEVNS